MSIRSKILAGCLALTMLSGLLGVFAQLAERRLGQLGLDIYDNAFMAVSYLRAAQVEFTALPDRPDRATIQSTHDDLMDDMRVVEERAMTQHGRTEAGHLRQLVDHALTGSTADPHARAQAAAAFERVVETYAGDGFRYRRRVGELVAGETHRNLIAVAATLLAALSITTLLAHFIAPPVRRAVCIAQAIAAGQLDNVIVPRGRGETADLLRALAIMQTSIATAIDRIRRLMAEQATHHAGEMSQRAAQMEAALGNMSQGLCLFAADDTLLVANARFASMFGMPQIGADAESIIRQAGLGALLEATNASRITSPCHDLPDGRTIAISQQDVSSGGWVVTFDDISERRAAEAKLAYMARHDGLTGLPNRVRLTEHLHSLERHTAPVAMLSINLERFKSINDTLGHENGDMILREVAGRLRRCVEHTDLLARLGDDEFAIVRAGSADPAGASLLAERIIAIIADPFEIDGQAILLACCIGIALSDSDPTSLLALPVSADLALQDARMGGGQRYNFFEVGMNARLQERRQLEHDLHNAMSAGQLEVFYQPLIKSEVGLSGFEALMRWRHPLRGLVSPAVFIPVAEEIGMIGALGQWVLQQACQDAAGWDGNLTVAVNLSPLQFRDRDLMLDVEGALHSSALLPSRLQLEITEGVLLQDDERVLATLHAIRNLGVRIAMDDFGTGYSSLGYLRRFPFDKIKIDQSFVRHMTDQTDCLAIVRTIIGLGRSLGMEVNAEGVETESQMRALVAEGCGELQGYLFSKPRPAADVSGMIESLRNATARPNVSQVSTGLENRLEAA